MKPIKRHAFRAGGGVALALGLLATPDARAATHPGAATGIAELLRIDALGYECIAAVDLDAAFRSTDKPFRLPRTCIPEPCARLLSRPQLARILGRPPTDALWQDYLERHARTCRDVAPCEAIVSGTHPDAPRFWTALIAAEAERAGGWERTFRHPAHGADGGGPIFRWPARRWSDAPGNAPKGPGGTDTVKEPSDPPSPVPLPPALPLLLGGLLMLCWRGARR